MTSRKVFVFSSFAQCDLNAERLSKEELATQVVLASGFEEVYSHQINSYITNLRPSMHQSISDSRNVKDKEAAFNLLLNNLSAEFALPETKRKYFQISIKAHENYFENSELCSLLVFTLGQKASIFQAKVLPTANALSAMLGQMSSLSAWHKTIDTLRKNGNWIE
jgi:hypothetical protein